MTDTQLIQSVIKMQEELVSALAEVSRLTVDMAQAKLGYEAQTKLIQEQAVKSFSSSDEERDQVMRFLFNVQKSGITNMMAADEFIQKRFGFIKPKCQDYLFEFIDNYTELEILYSKPKVEPKLETVDVSGVLVKKRKGPKPYSEMTPEELADAKSRKAVRDAKSVAPSAVPLVAPSAVPLVPVKKTILKLKKKEEEPKPKGVLIWNAFMNTVKVEMMQADNTVEPSYNDIMKKAQELKEADPESYKLFSENWTP